MTAGSSLELAAGPAQLRVDAACGGRLASVRVDGHELLVPPPAEPIWWGSYPMVPFAGRIRDGRFRFRGREYALERNNPPHAIHGTVFERAWQIVDATTIAIDLGPGWPFRGHVTQHFDLRPERLVVGLTLDAEDAMPAMLGWHPWFRRRLDAPLPPRGSPAQSPPAEGEVRLTLDAGTMYLRGADGLPTGQRGAPSAGPWDDCFTDLRHDPVLEWPGIVRLTVASSLDHWVVFDELARGVCVEPQSGPPDEVNAAPRVLEAGGRMTATMTWRWA